MTFKSFIKDLEETFISIKHDTTRKKFVMLDFNWLKDEIKTCIEFMNNKTLLKSNANITFINLNDLLLLLVKYNTNMVFDEDCNNILNFINELYKLI